MIVKENKVVNVTLTRKRRSCLVSYQIDRKILLPDRRYAETHAPGDRAPRHGAWYPLGDWHSCADSVPELRGSYAVWNVGSMMFVERYYFSEGLWYRWLPDGSGIRLPCKELNSPKTRSRFLWAGTTKFQSTRKKVKRD